MTRVKKSLTAQTQSENASEADMIKDADPMTYLEQEFATFLNELSELTKEHEGEYALVCGSVLTVMSTEESALAQGYRTFAPHPFLVRQILLEPKVEVVTRVLCPR